MSSTPVEKPTIELPALELPIDPSDLRSVVGKLSIKTGATSILQTCYWKLRSAIVSAIDPIYDQIDDE